jgi:hypothetical protein
MPWIHFYQPQSRRGMYLGAHDSVARYKVIHLEMFPGVSGPRAAGNWPRDEERGDLPAGVKLAMVHTPYARPGTMFRTSTVVLRCFEGDARAAANVYGQWFASQFDLQKPRANWMNRVLAYQECRDVPFKELPRWAAAGDKRGVRGLPLTGWKQGGHANGLPRFEPDSRLGSREDLAAAIRECHKLGVRVALLVNLQPACQEDDWYRTELSTDWVWDRLLAVTQVSSRELPEQSALRSAFPLLRPTSVVAERFDWAAVNAALRCGGRVRIAPANGQPMGGPEFEELSRYVQTIAAAREALGPTLLKGECLGAQGLDIRGTAPYSVFRNHANGLRTAVLVNSRAKPVQVRVAGFGDQDVKRLVLWQPATGARGIALPADIVIDGDQVALLTEEPALDRLAQVPRWQPPDGAKQEQVTQSLFSFASDLALLSLTRCLSVRVQRSAKRIHHW